MVLDIEFFRSDKGHDPKKVRENQEKRFKDLKLVETVIDEGIQKKFYGIKLKFHNMSHYSRCCLETKPI